MRVSECGEAGVLGVRGSGDSRRTKDEQKRGGG